MTGMFPWDEEEQDQQTTVTPIVCGEATAEEAEKAFDDLFYDSNYYFEKIMKGIWL